VLSKRILSETLALLEKLKEEPITGKEVACLIEKTLDAFRGERENVIAYIKENKLHCIPGERLEGLGYSANITHVVEVVVAPVENVSEYRRLHVCRIFNNNSYHGVVLYRDDIKNISDIRGIDWVKNVCGSREVVLPMHWVEYLLLRRKNNLEWCQRTKDKIVRRHLDRLLGSCISLEVILGYSLVEDTFQMREEWWTAEEQTRLREWYLRTNPKIFGRCSRDQIVLSREYNECLKTNRALDTMNKYLELYCGGMTIHAVSRVSNIPSEDAWLMLSLSLEYHWSWSWNLLNNFLFGREVLMRTGESYGRVIG